LILHPYFGELIPAVGTITECTSKEIGSVERSRLDEYLRRYNGVKNFAAIKEKAIQIYKKAFDIVSFDSVAVSQVEKLKIRGCFLISFKIHSRATMPEFIAVGEKSLIYSVEREICNCLGFQFLT